MGQSIYRLLLFIAYCRVMPWNIFESFLENHFLRWNRVPVRFSDDSNEFIISRLIKWFNYTSCIGPRFRRDKFIHVQFLHSWSCPRALVLLRKSREEKPTENGIMFDAISLITLTDINSSAGLKWANDSCTDDCVALVVFALLMLCSLKMNAHCIMK